MKKLKILICTVGLLISAFFAFSSSVQAQTGLDNWVQAPLNNFNYDKSIDHTALGRVGLSNGQYSITVPARNGKGYVETTYNARNMALQVVGWGKDGKPIDVRNAKTPTSKADAARFIDALYGAGTAQDMVNIDIQQGSQNLQPKTEPGEAKDCLEVSWLISVELHPEMCIAQFVANPLLWLSSKVLWMAAVLFNFAVYWSMQFKTLLENTRVVGIGWTIFRDIANICFIFILLAIAIGTILRVESYHVKKLLATVIIVAVFINFSLFLGKVVIDASNIMALQFYSKIAPAGQGQYSGGISDAFIDALGMEGIFNEYSKKDLRSQRVIETDEGTEQRMRNIIIIGFGGSALMLVTAFVLFVGSFLFLLRTIVLIILLLLSPLAFLAAVLPKTRTYWDQWLSTLLKESFFAPIFLLMIYIVLAAVTSSSDASGKSKGTNFASLLAGDIHAIPVLFNYLILIGLMIGSLIIAKMFGTQLGGIVRGTVGAASVGGSAWLGRRIGGGLGSSLAKSKWVSRLQGTNNLFANSNKVSQFAGKAIGTVARSSGRGLRNTGNYAATSSFDVRGAPAGLGGLVSGAGLGSAGGAGGYQKGLDDKKKNELERRKQEAVSRKKAALQTALNMPKGDETQVKERNAKIQEALIQFSDSEYKELGGAILTNEDVVRNSTWKQITAATDEKNEGLGQNHKDKIASIRQQDLRDALGLQATDPTRSAKIDAVLDKMSDEEKKYLPMDLLINRDVFSRLGKGVQDKIASRDNMTESQRTQYNNTRSQELVDQALSTTPDTSLIRKLIRGMSGKELLKINNDPKNNATGPIRNGYGILGNPEVAEQLSPEQLREMANVGTGSIHNASTIAGHIRYNPNANGEGYMNTDEGDRMWP